MDPVAQPFAEPCSRGVIAAEPCPRERGREVARGTRRIVLTACILASSMAFIDGSVLTVALPRLREDFGADFVSVQWVLNGYVLALASLTLIGGALADVYGRARTLALGCIVFGLASVACALAPSVTLLIAARVVQGIAAAIVTPASLALIGAVYPREERNQAIGVWAAASALTTAGGPILGGWLTENFGWPLVFWINPPLALMAVVLLLGFAPEDRREKRPFDMPGAVILATSLGVLAWALSQIGPAEPAGTPAPAVLPITVAIVAALGGFAVLCGLGAHKRSRDDAAAFVAQSRVRGSQSRDSDDLCGPVADVLPAAVRSDRAPGTVRDRSGPDLASVHARRRLPLERVRRARGQDRRPCDARGRTACCGARVPLDGAHHRVLADCWACLGR